MTIANFVRGWLLVVPLVPSVLVAIFNLYHLLFNRALRIALNNHVIVLLLLCGLLETLTDIIWQITYYQNGVVLSPTSAFCITWSYLGSTFYISSFILMAWASIERHILVFHPNWLRNKMNRLYLHYIPLAACIVYPAIFYLIFIVVLPCNASYNYNRRGCSRYACVTVLPWVALWDSIGHYILPAFITVIFSILLIVRVIYRRYRVRGQIDWRNYKKMTAQLLPISFLYMALQLPPMVLYAGYSGGLSFNIGGTYYSDGLYFTYWLVMITPFATVISLPDLKTKCRNLLFWRRNRAVQPVVTKTVRRDINKPAVIEVPQQNINQPAATEVASRNANQPEAIQMTPHNADQSQAVEVVQQNVHQLPGMVTIHRHLDQPVPVLPDVQ